MAESTNQKSAVPEGGGIIEAKPYKWSCDIEFPENISVQITQLLKLAATAHLNGSEMHMVVVGIDAAGENYFLDTTGCPPPIIPSFIMMNADKYDWVAAVTCTEGWTLPEEERARFVKDRRPDEQIKDHPRSYEVLMVQVETLKGTWTGEAKIIGEAPNQIVRDEIHLNKSAAALGRMNNLLKPNWSNDLLGTLKKTLDAKMYYAAEKSDNSEEPKE